jgi:hypothetical protein
MAPGMIAPVGQLADSGFKIANKKMGGPKNEE